MIKDLLATNAICVKFNITLFAITGYTEVDNPKKVDIKYMTEGE